jgi:hypothetical protein
MDADPLDVMRKAMRLQEGIAAREQKKGDKASLRLMADAMTAAASLAAQIAAIEDRRGIVRAIPGGVDRLEIELIEGPGTAAQRDALKVENEALRAQLEAFRNQQRALSYSADQSQPPAPTAPSNVVPIVAVWKRPA